ncbi:unnamed protein product [Caenorhabditis brenneri]
MSKQILCWLAKVVGRLLGTSCEISIGTGCETLGTVTHEIGHDCRNFEKESAMIMDRSCTTWKLCFQTMIHF